MSYSSANNNQLASIGGTAVSYDAAGNLLSDPTCSPVANYTWDAEGRLSRITLGATTYSTSTYNAPGQDVEDVYPVFSNAKTEGIFDPSGRELSYYNGSSNAWYDRDIWVAGRMFAQSYPNETYFLHANRQNTDTQVTNHSGAVTLDMLYNPWGQIWTHTGSMSDAHFAGLEQGAGNLYNTPTRRYSNPQGRWLIPDPENSGADSGDPQTWNAYAYVRNNPTTLTDPEGTDYKVCTTDENGKQTCTAVPVSNSEFAQVASNPGPGITLQGDTQSGIILATNANGEQVQARTYRYVPEAGAIDVTNNVVNVVLLGYGLGRAAASFAAGVAEGLTARATLVAADEASTIGGAHVAAQAALRGGGVLDRIIQTSAGPVRVYAEVTAEGTTAVVKDLAIYPANSEAPLNVGYTEMRQGLRAIQGELREAGFTHMRVENAYRISGANPGRTTTFTVTLR